MRSLWRKLAKLTINLAAPKIEQDCEISLMVTGNQQIQELNAAYRNVDMVTDVLSFPQGDDDFVVPGEPLILGDIVICWPRALEQAEQFGHSIEREAGFLFIHGLLHLLGYDHIETKQEEQMRLLQRQIIESAGLAIVE